MPSHSRKNNAATAGRVLCVCAVWAGGMTLQAQDSPSGGSPSNVTATGQSGTSNQSSAEPSGDASSSSRALDYLYNRKPQDGSPAAALERANQRTEDKMLAADVLGGTEIVNQETAARFERYLGAEEIPASRVRAYLDAISQVHEALKTKQQPVQAWELLVKLADYEELDAGVSLELANRIESIWNLDKTALQLADRNRKLQDEVDLRSRNADSMSRRVREEDLKFERKQSNSGVESKKRGNTPIPTGPPGGDVPDASASAPTVSGGDIASLGGKIQLTEEYLKSLEAKARIKMNEMRMSELEETAKENFANYIGTLFSSKRYLHVIMAADFYRRIFNDSEYPVSLANQVNASLEIVKDLNSTVDVFRYKIQKGEVANATDRLQEAFILGETHALVLGVERKYKERVGSYATQLVKMRNLIEAREFGDLETLLDSMQKTASDFDATKARAIVNAVKLESKLRLGKAKLAAQKGNLDLAMKEFEAAAEAWPGNPELEKSASQFFETNDVQNQSLTDFDRDFELGNFRMIYEKQLAYAPAIKGDEEREKKLKASLEKVQQAEIATEKANLQMRNGDHYGAWETVELASKNWPEDRKLNQMRAELSGKSAEFVAAINKAKDAEARGELGYSLTCYLNAQRNYPASRISNEAIERLTAAILDPDSAKKDKQPSTPEPTDDNASGDPS